MEYLKLFFYLIFITANYLVYTFTIHIQNQNDCECRTGWKIENLKMLSILSIIMGIINLIIPLNKTIYNIPLISGFFSIGLLLLLFMEIFTLVRFVRNLVNDEKCSNTCQINGYETLIEYSYDLSITICISIAIAITVGLLYM